MTRRQVLVVCMFDSIHAGRWLSQFTDQDIDFTLFPSKKFKRVHPKLASLIKSKKGARYSIAHPLRINMILGYLDFLFFLQFSKIFRRNFRAYYLKKILAGKKYDFVHALEIQGAGYLCDEAIIKKDFKFILTNWGSDIFYFQHLPEHLPRIRSVLAKADLYSAECQRDYKLATKLGFNGHQLPCIPNGGGLVVRENLSTGIPTSFRNNIVVKTYGGTFGRGGLAIGAVTKILKENSHLTAYFYSVTEDLLGQTLELKAKYEDRVNFSTLKNPISHTELEEIFSNSRVYIGCSISDGISTSFLEALAKGVYPIQTNTSCAGEWVDKGAIASLIDLNTQQLEDALNFAVSDSKAVDLAGKKNIEVAKELLSVSKISRIAQEFYK
jgi:glycosyltransferase involved in cell wall biosynthesis